LVVSTDLKGFMVCANQLFPGASIHIAGDYTEETNWADKIIHLLSNPELPPTITTDQLGKLLNTRWRQISSNVLTADFRRALEAIGWLYVSGRGRKGSRFDRIAWGYARVA
jgi:hypothetical protein